VRLLIFGFGYTGAALAERLIPQGWDVDGVARSERSRAAMQACGVRPINPESLDAAAGEARAILVAAPPDETGCPGLHALSPALARTRNFPDWIGYLSSTGVYGDRGGGWVLEESRLAARSPEGARRVRAECDWMQVGRGMGLTVTAFRLPGIYGPALSCGLGGRSPFDRLRAGTARRIVKLGQVFSRIHVHDLAAGLEASLRRPRPGGVYNLCDDLPAPPQDVTAYAAALLGLPPPPEVGFDSNTQSPMQQRFYAESKRVSNAHAKAELGWQLAYPTYREGLEAVLASESEVTSGTAR